jgi:hypothetical protein
MTHDSTWLGRTRAGHGARTVTALTFALGCILLVLVGFASTASASAPEMRGEWEIVLKTGAQSNTGTTVIRQEAGPKGEFASEAVQLLQGSPGTFEGTLEGSNAKVKITTSPSGPFPASEFESATMTVTSGAGTLEISGEGTFSVPAFSLKSTGTVVAKRIKTYKEVEEREARELKEKEEKEAKEAIRGEWALTIEYGQTAKGTAIISEEANAKNEFVSSEGLFESFIPGSFSGTLEGKEASLRIATEAAGPYPATTFAGTKIAVTLTGSSMSMTGTGMFSADGNSLPATVTATRVKTYQEVIARERAEAEAKAKQEQEAQEAQEAQEKAEREAKEKGERETKERREREAREEVEKANKITLQPPSSLPLVTPPAMPVVVATKTLTVPSGGAVSLKLTNPNGSSATGQLKVTTTIKLPSSKHGGHAKSKTITLGGASFSLAGNGTETVKIVLSHSARSDLAHLKTMHALVTLTTETGGKQATAATYKLTLSAPAHKKG